MRAMFVAAMLLLPACSFAGSMSVDVETWGGPVQPLRFPPDGIAVIDAAFAIEEACVRGRDSLPALVDQAERMMAVFDEVVTAWEAWLTGDLQPKLVEAAPDYVRHWGASVVALLAAAQANDDAAWTAAYDGARKALITDRSIDGVRVADYLRAALKRRLRAAPPAQIALFDEISEALVATAPGLRQALTHREEDQTVFAGSQLADALSDLTIQEEDIIVVPLVPLKVADLEAQRATLEGLRSMAVGLAEVELRRVVAARIAVSKLATRLVGGREDSSLDERRFPHLVRAMTQLQHRAEEFVEALRIQSEPLLEEARAIGLAYRKVLDFLLKESRVAALRGELRAALLRRLSEARKKPVTFDRLFAVLRAELTRTQRALTATVAGPAAARNAAANAVEAIRSRPFVAVDPNVPVITACKMQKHWNRSPVDGLSTRGDGFTQFVIIQDGPTSYRLKELHVDPQGVIDLRIAVADLAVDVLAEVARSQLGIAAPAKGTGQSDAESGGDPPPELRDAVLAEKVDAMSGDTRGMLRDLATFLRGQLEQLEPAGAGAKPTVATRLRGRLTADHSRLTALKARAEAVLHREGATDNGAAGELPGGK